MVSHLEDMGHQVRKVGVKDDLAVIRQAIAGRQAADRLQPDGELRRGRRLRSARRQLPRADEDALHRLQSARTDAVARQGARPDRCSPTTASRSPSSPWSAGARCPGGSKRLTFPADRQVAHRGGVDRDLAGVGRRGRSGAARTRQVRPPEHRHRRDRRAVHRRPRTLRRPCSGTSGCGCFPVWEMNFAQMPDRAHRIASERVKWNDAYREKYGIMTGPADLPADLAQHLQHICKRVYRTLNLSGYARIDLRLDADGRAYVLEANPNPQLAYGEDFAEAAEHAGIGLRGTAPADSRPRPPLATRAGGLIRPPDRRWAPGDQPVFLRSSSTATRSTRPVASLLARMRRPAPPPRRTARQGPPSGQRGVRGRSCASSAPQVRVGASRLASLHSTPGPLPRHRPLPVHPTVAPPERRGFDGGPASSDARVGRQLWATK